MLTLCGIEVGQFMILQLFANYIEIGQYRRSISNECRMVHLQMYYMVNNGTNYRPNVTWTLNGTSNGGFTIPANTVSLVKLGDNTDVTTL